MSKFYDSQGNVVEAQLITQIQRVLAFSTTAVLGNAGVYTSPTVDAINYKAYTLYISSDQAGSYFRQSSMDGITWYNETATAVALAAAGVGGSQTNFNMRYWRLVYTNGATTQGTFLATLYLSAL